MSQDESLQREKKAADDANGLVRWENTNKQRRERNRKKQVCVCERESELDRESDSDFLSSADALGLTHCAAATTHACQ